MGDTPGLRSAQAWPLGLALPRQLLAVPEIQYMCHRLIFQFLVLCDSYEVRSAQMMLGQVEGFPALVSTSQNQSSRQAGFKCLHIVYKEGQEELYSR